MTVSVSVLPLVAWRFARVQRDSFAFWDCLNDADYDALLRETFAQPEQLQLVADALRLSHDVIDRDLARTGSNARRRQRYFGDILRSATLGHHLGKRGGVGLQHPQLDCPAPCALEIALMSRGLDECNEYISVALFDSVVEHWQQSHRLFLRQPRTDVSDPRGLDLLLDLAPVTLSVAPSELESTTEAIALQVGALMRSSGLFDFPRPVVFPISVDFLVASGCAPVLEVHVPGRGFGPHLFPFLFAGLDVLSLARTSLGHLDVDIKLSYSPRSFGAFALLDRSFWRLAIPPARTSTTIWCDDDTVDWFTLPDFLRTRQFGYLTELGISQPKRLVHFQGDDLNLAKVVVTLGQQVVCKSYDNRPWWSRDTAPRVHFFNLHLASDRRRLHSITMKYSVVMEEAIYSSIDPMGRSGEARTFAIVLIR